MVRGRIRQFCSKNSDCGRKFQSANWSIKNHPCQGGEYVKISQRGDALFVVYDHVSPVGRVVSVGVIDPEEGWIGIGNRVSSGRAYAASPFRTALFFLS